MKDKVKWAGSVQARVRVRVISGGLGWAEFGLHGENARFVLLQAIWGCLISRSDQCCPWTPSRAKKYSNRAPESRLAPSKATKNTFRSMSVLVVIRVKRKSKESALGQNWMGPPMILIDSGSRRSRKIFCKLSLPRKVTLEVMFLSAAKVIIHSR